MSSQGREKDLVAAFVRMADTLIADFDVIELLHGLCDDCVTLLGVDAAGLLLTDQRGSLQVVSASTEAAHLVELFQLQAEQGPCLDCFATTAPVHAGDLGTESRWPLFTDRARQEGYAAVHALPMRLRGQTIGALNLFHRRPTAMQEQELRVGQALADVATIAILAERSTRERELLTEQLQGALNSRVIIEQAKGMLAERARIGMDEAFARLRRHARDTGTRLADVARGLTEATLDATPLLEPPGR
ncbi:GAF and ANTAR domain-containing protein [Pseudonocardia sp. KRD-291]|nr:GAF and ANTAR domain-containing protein [Pseudonocardia sp. KRD291]